MVSRELCFNNECSTWLNVQFQNPMKQVSSDVNGVHFSPQEPHLEKHLNIDFNNETTFLLKFCHGCRHFAESAAKDGDGKRVGKMEQSKL